MSAPSTLELLERAVRRGLLDAHVSMPGEVVAVDLVKNTVDVKPKLRKPIATPRGELAGDSLPILRNVPIHFPGANGYRVTFPIAKGDDCWLLFADYSLDTWKGEGAEVDPIDVRAHHLTDAVALFGIRPLARAVTAPADAATFGSDELNVAVKETTIELGGAAEAVAIASKVAAQLSALKDVLNTWVPVPTDGGLALKTLLTPFLATWPGDVGSATVKAKD